MPEIDHDGDLPDPYEGVFRFHDCSVFLGGVAAGGSPGGFLSEVTVIVRKRDGTEEAIRYVRKD